MVFPVKSREIKEITKGEKGKMFIFFVPLFTLCLLSKIVRFLCFNFITSLSGSTSSKARERREISPPSSATDFTHSVFHRCKF